MSRQETIDKIQKFFKSISPQVDGVIISRYTGMEAGITTYNFDILTIDGFYSGYWTETKPGLGDSEIVRNIIESEDCEFWEDMSDAEIETQLRLLQSVVQEN